MIKRKLPSMYHQFKELAEVDITKEAMEVGPTLHYFMGGIRVDHDTQMSKVPGLFAAGEAGAGLHGANRLGGNSLSDLLVFGRLAGEGAANYIKKNTGSLNMDEEQIKTSVRRATDILNRESGTNPYLVHEDLQQVMQDNVGIIRAEDELKKAVDELQRLKKDSEKVKAPGSSQYNPGWHEAISLRSMMITAEAVTRAALERKESRGAHTRLDFFGEDKEWQKYNLVIRKGNDGNMEVEKVTRTSSSPELERIANASIEALDAEVAAERQSMKVS